MTDILQKIKESKKNLFVGVAGPGTGKTTAFKTIIEAEEYKNKKILILSFINKLVDDLSDDFKSFNNVEVSTLHAFARKIIKNEVGDVDLDKDLDKIIGEDYFFIKNCKTKYEEKFYENKPTEDEEKFYKERKSFYKYGKELYSFNSIIYAVNRFFSENEDQIPKYDLVLIDEFQDFNKSECELIKLLNKKNKVVIVGDDDQSLYGSFRGAKPEQIRNLYNDLAAEKFSLDYCYRCTEVLVNIANNLIKKAKEKGHLKDRLEDKKFLYPSERKDNKNEISKKYPQVDFIASVCGEKLIYELVKSIKDYKGNDKKRILVLVPSYLKQTMYDGLIEKGFHVADFELFSDEECNEKKHKNLIGAFETLAKRKTDNLSLRKILFLYFDNNEIKKILQKNKKIWLCLRDVDKGKIEKDVKIFKKTKSGKKKLNEKELNRFDKIFTVKNVLSKLIKGFKPVVKGSTEIEMTTVMSSKGLSGDIVCYVGIDDRIILDRKTNAFTDQKLCEFLVGITRAKEKLVLVSFQDKNPKILEFIEKEHINRI